MRKRTMQNLSQTKKRSAYEKGGLKRKYRKGGKFALKYLKEKGEEVKRRKYQIGKGTYGRFMNEQQ